MNKKLNTVFFILGATLFNVLTALIAFILLLVIYIRVISIAGAGSENADSIGVPFIFIGAIAISYFAYRLVFKFISKKFNLEKYFAPLFGYGRRPPPKNQD